MSPTRFQTFGPQTPVVPGITLLEASAGTGKTYQITNLVLRLVVDRAVPLPRILVVTFTKAATAELKDRVRQRLVAAQRAVELGQAPPEDTLLQRFIADAAADAEHARQIRRRLRRAREEFDQALISTIHGFCQRTLQLHAFETGTAFGRALQTDSTEVLHTIVDDWIVARLHSASEPVARLLRDGCGVQRAALRSLVRLAVADPDMPCVPSPPPADLPGWRRAVAALTDGLDDPDHPAQVLTRLVRDKRKAFDGRTYGARYADARLASLQAWASAADALPVPTEVWVRWFSPAQLADRARSPEGEALARDPFFGRLSALVEHGLELPTAERAAFVAHARAELQAHHRRHDTQSFHDLLRDLDRVLADPERGPALCAAIRGRYDAALIDEFQDTDALQWRIFGRVFGGMGDPTDDHYLYLIGDPKQAIYGFRGANVHVYLAARDAAPADRRFTMRRNYRSDGRLIAAMNHLLHRPGVFGAAGIDYIAVDAHHTADRLTFPADHPPTDTAPLQLVWSDARAQGGDALELLGNGDLNTLLAEACASDLVDLLHGPARVEGRAVRPGDCAVLVRSHTQADAVHAALRSRDVPAVISSQGQVFATPVARSLQRWLEALSQPGDDALARLLAADALLAWSAAELPSAGSPADDDDTVGAWWEAWLAQLGRWRAQFHRDGFMAAFRALLDHVPPWSSPPTTVASRLLASPGGERRMTNLLHLGELLHAWHVGSGGGLVGLHSWLERQRHDGHADTDAAELRLETDDEAVQVVTVHKSKGLQYGVVFAPFSWKDEGGRSAPPVVATDPTDPTRRELVVTTQGDLADAAAARADIDSRAEGTRLLYVALTRARHRCVVYWPGVGQPRDRRAHSPLAAVLHGAPPSRPSGCTDRVAAAAERLDGGDLADPADQLSELMALAAASVRDGGPTVGVRPLTPPHDHRWVRPPAPRLPLGARRLLGRVVYDGWRRHSYSALTRADLAAQADEAVDPARGLGFDDDGHQGSRSPHSHVQKPERPDTGAMGPDVPLAPFPAGADAGTCLHAIFEHIDFQACAPGSSDPTHLEAIARRELTHHGFSEPEHLALVTDHFPAVLATPLGPLLPSTRLCDVARADRLDELRFDFPVAGGDDHGRTAAAYQRVTAGALRDALALRGDDDVVPLAWVDRVADLGFAPLAGMMTGSIDLVFRVRTAEDPVGRWFVVDYKSNRLDPHQTGRTPLAHFLHAGMRYEMAHHHYFLQYHIYTLALHRYLRARLGDHYDYDRHFGGAVYLFVRGMTGADAVDPTRDGGRPGVFADRPPRRVVDALDRVFHGADRSAPSSPASPTVPPCP